MRPARPRAPGVDDIGDDFLARAAFAGDQHPRLRRRDQRHFLKQRQRERTLRDDLRRQFFFRAEIQRRERRDARGLADRGQQFIQVNRLGEIIQRAVAHRDHRVADVGVGGDEQDRQRGKLRTHAAQAFPSRTSPASARRKSSWKNCRRATAPAPARRNPPAPFQNSGCAKRNPAGCAGPDRHPQSGCAAGAAAIWNFRQARAKARQIRRSPKEVFPSRIHAKTQRREEENL